MKVLFVIDSLGFIEPLGITYLSSIAKKHGHRIALSVLSKQGHETLEHIRNDLPDVVAYSSVTGQHRKFFDFNKVLKTRYPSIFTIMGGPHATYYSQCVKKEMIDAICVGEGELAFIELLECLEKGKDISGVANIHTKDFQNPVRNLIADLDSLPMPDRELLFQFPALGQFPFKIFLTSRGCPYSCSYCFEPVFRAKHKEIGKYVRKHSVDRVLEEVKHVQRQYPLEIVNFKDDLFVAKLDPWVEELCSRFPREIGLPFACLLRPDTITDDLIRVLKQGGCVSIILSVDSANERIRREIVGKHFSNERIREALSITNKYSINVFNNMILGLPGATARDELDGVNLNQECGVKFASFTILVPYPETPIADYCKKQGYFDIEPDAISDTLFGRSQLNCFSEREKDIQENILHLGNFALSLPRWARTIVLNKLIYARPNRLFALIGRLTFIYKLKKNIYPIKTTWKQIKLQLYKILFPVEKY